MIIYKVSIETLFMYAGRTNIYTLGYYKDLNQAKREAKIAIEDNYKKYGSSKNPIIDYCGRKEYLIINEAIYTEIVVK